MKKVVITGFFLLLAFAWSSADTGINYIDAKIDGSKLNEANADLAQIEIDFCDKPGEKVIVYNILPGWRQDICLKVTNMSTKDIETTIEFVDGTLTNDERKNRACMQQGENKKFWQYITWFTASFTIPASDSSIHHATFILPTWATWTINGCLVYYTKSVKMGEGMNFSVLMRKAKFIDVHVRSQTFFEKYFIWLLIVALLLYYGKMLSFPNKTKKLPKR